MATRSTIAIEYADGSVGQVYCHWDGYLSNNGEILRDHYSDPFKLRDLIDQGAISSLRPNIGEKHHFSMFEAGISREDYDRLYGDMTTFYARDRGEDLVKHSYKDIEDYKLNAQREEYNYILRQVDGNAVWFVEFYLTDGNFVTLEDAIVEQKVLEDA